MHIYTLQVLKQRVSLTKTGMYAYIEAGVLTCSPDRVQTRPDLRLVELKTTTNVPEELPEHIRAQVI